MKKENLSSRWTFTSFMFSAFFPEFVNIMVSQTIIFKHTNISLQCDDHKKHLHINFQICIIVLCVFVLLSPTIICVRVCVCVCAHVRGSKLDVVEVLCFRDRTLQGSRSIQHSLIFQIKLPKPPPASGNSHVCVCLCVWQAALYSPYF